MSEMMSKNKMAAILWGLYMESVCRGGYFTMIA